MRIVFDDGVTAHELVLRHVILELNTSSELLLDESLEKNGRVVGGSLLVVVETDHDGNGECAHDGTPHLCNHFTPNEGRCGVGS